MTTTEKRWDTFCFPSEKENKTNHVRRICKHGSFRLCRDDAAGIRRYAFYLAIFRSLCCPFKTMIMINLQSVVGVFGLTFHADDGTPRSDIVRLPTDKM